MYHWYDVCEDERLLLSVPVEIQCSCHEVMLYVVISRTNMENTSQLSVDAGRQVLPSGTFEHILFNRV
jgi:hypothetical protein